MARATAKIRLYVTAELSAGASVALDRDQARYLFSVMRLVVGVDVCPVLVDAAVDERWRALAEQAVLRSSSKAENGACQLCH